MSDHDSDAIICVDQYFALKNLYASGLNLKMKIQLNRIEVSLPAWG